ncbi:hypothetical protein K488DRAFT_50003 [Vararia minispora EC-137]|uniref:Uncharacterized protein n=1 Tax=Vararia minispora EC-137 TaxID=1314806 RepID=A0ACB8QKP0_9AGAM|nr:hypothetical protein K488DRAFT_50003 [Vararia minispora EC-137]
MVLKMLDAAVTAFLSPKYYPHVVIGAVLTYALYMYAQGRKTTRERDLHGRTVLVTGAFTPIGLTLLDALAKRGAHIIALSPDPVDTGPSNVLVPLLRSTHNNELIYAEHCDLRSPASIRAFVASLVKTENQRIDAVVFAHEYAPMDSIFGTKARPRAAVDKERREASAATFLLITLLLPLLLVAPVERDIRLITLINPFYAAAAGRFAVPAPTARRPAPLLFAEGRRALRSAVLMRHLQRVLDALPSGGQVPRTDALAQTVTVISGKKQRSNIVAVSVSPGVNRSDVVAPLLGADFSRGVTSWRGLVIYILFNPLLRLFTKSAASSLETVLHALFLPTPFKLFQATAVESEDASTPAPARRAQAEVLKPGALYAECSVIPLHVPPASPPPAPDGAPEAKLDEPDDGELGGVALGTAVWEEFERELKKWEAEEKQAGGRREKQEGSRGGTNTPPTVDEDVPTVDEGPRGE